MSADIFCGKYSTVHKMLMSHHRQPPSFVERETGLEPATACLEDAEKARRAPLAPFLLLDYRQSWVACQDMEHVLIKYVGHQSNFSYIKWYNIASGFDNY